MRRSLLWVVVILTALLLQSTVFAQITLAGAKPDLVYLVTIAMAMLDLGGCCPDLPGRPEAKADRAQTIAC